MSKQRSAGHRTVNIRPQALRAGSGVSGTRAKPGIGTTLIPVRFTKLLVRGATAVGDRLRENFHPIRTCVVITVLIW